MEQHTFLNVYRALDFLQLGLLPGKRRREWLIASKSYKVTSESAKSFSKHEALRQVSYPLFLPYLQKNSHKSKF